MTPQARIDVFEISRGASIRGEQAHLDELFREIIGNGNMMKIYDLRLRGFSNEQRSSAITTSSCQKIKFEGGIHDSSRRFPKHPCAELSFVFHPIIHHRIIVELTTSVRLD